jgi:WS/DGAT/MGAT family acyltransferase
LNYDKKLYGTTVNDVILAICGGALRNYLVRQGNLPDTPLIAVCPTSVRGSDGDSTSNNRVSAMFTTLATDIDDPAERIFAIQRVTKGAKEEHNAIGATFLQDWAEFAAPNTFNLASRLYSSLNLADSHRPVHNVVISNVPGPPFPLYYAGAEMVAAYPMGPLVMGAGLNITVLSYRDSVDFGFMACRELMPDVWDLADDVEVAFAELQKAAGVPAAKRVDAKPKIAREAAPEAS